MNAIATFNSFDSHLSSIKSLSSDEMISITSKKNKIPDIGIRSTSHDQLNAKISTVTKRNSEEISGWMTQEKNKK